MVQVVPVETMSDMGVFEIFAAVGVTVLFGVVVLLLCILVANAARCLECSTECVFSFLYPPPDTKRMLDDQDAMEASEQHAMEQQDDARIECVVEPGEMEELGIDNQDNDTDVSGGNASSDQEEEGDEGGGEDNGIDL